MAVIHALSIWKHYLLGAYFIIKTDYQSLRYFLNQRKLSEKQICWVNFLSMFHFQILHTPDHKNVIVDALSRLPRVNAVTKKILLQRQPSMQKKMILRLYGLNCMKVNLFHLNSLKDGFLYHQQAICVMRSLRSKVMSEAHAPSYAGHRGIMPTT